MFPFFQSSKTAQNQHRPPKVTESGLMMTWTSSLNPQTCNLSGWLNLIYSITLEAWNFWRQILPMKTKVKKTQSTLAFSIHFTTWKMKCIIHKHHPSLQAWSVNTCQRPHSSESEQSDLSWSEVRALLCATGAAEQFHGLKNNRNQFQDAAIPQNLAGLCIKNDWPSSLFRQLNTFGFMIPCLSSQGRELLQLCLYTNIYVCCLASSIKFIFSREIWESLSPLPNSRSFLSSCRGDIFTLSLSVKFYLYLLKLNMFKVNLFLSGLFNLFEQIWFILGC